MTSCQAALKFGPVLISPSSGFRAGPWGSFHSGSHFRSINWMNTKAGPVPRAYCFTGQRRRLNGGLPGSGRDASAAVPAGRAGLTAPRSHLSG